MCFDLKGSQHKRYTKIGSDSKFWNNTQNFSKILKDKNIMEINKDTDQLLIQLP